MKNEKEKPLSKERYMVTSPGEAVQWVQRKVKVGRIGGRDMFLT